EQHVPVDGALPEHIHKDRDREDPFDFVQRMEHKTSDAKTDRQRNAMRLEFQPGLHEADRAYEAQPCEGADEGDRMCEANGHWMKRWGCSRKKVMRSMNIA